jgi:protein TonB
MQSGRVPFRVQESRRWVLGSLAGHVGFTVLFSILGAAFLTPPPPLQLVQVNLQTLELPQAIRNEPEPEIVEEIVPPEPEPMVQDTETDPVPAPPDEVRSAPPEPVPDEDAGVQETSPVAPEPTAPEFELPREARPVPEVEPEDVDFLEPEAVQSSRPEVPATVSAAEPEEVSEGATVQASASEGVDDTYLRLVQQKIGRRWSPTDASTRGLREVQCVVSFRIGSGGEVISPTVTASSGLSVFDRRALAAVERSAPLPPPPARFGRTGVEIDFRFSYSR